MPLTSRFTAAIAVGLLSVCAAAAQTTASAPKVPDAKSSAPLYVQMADSEMNRNPDPMTIDATKPTWNYTQGLEFKAIFAVGEKTGDKRYYDYAKKYYDTMIGEGGAIRTYDINELSLDRINPGKPLFFLYEKTKEERFKQAAQLLHKQLESQPRTKEGGYWHKKRYPWQMWLDGLYMGSPFQAQYAKVFGEPALMDDVVNQLVWMEKHARDPKTGLLYHGWDESKEQKWADPVTGLSKAAWGRAMGWYAMGLVDDLDFLPKDHPRRGELLAILDRFATGILKVRDPKAGVWWQVVDQPNREGNYLESSASAMFAYVFAKAERMRYLDARFNGEGRKIYNAVVKQFVSYDATGMNLNRACAVAGLGGDPNAIAGYRDGSFDYYVHEPVRSNDPKAVGPFILAGLELEALKK